MVRNSFLFGLLTQRDGDIYFKAISRRIYLDYLSSRKGTIFQLLRRNQFLRYIEKVLKIFTPKLVVTKACSEIQVIGILTYSDHFGKLQKKPLLLKARKYSGRIATPATIWNTILLRNFFLD